MNISSSSITNYCDEKCAYSFKYTNSATCKASNLSFFIQLTYDKGSSPPVVFNNTTYEVSNIQIYSPSVHTYNNNNADGEIIIMHNSNDYSYALGVCIPISINGNSTNQTITNIVSSVVSKPLNTGEDMIIPLSEYNLNTIIPKSPYFYYVSDQTLNANFVAFSLNDAISLQQDLITGLRSIITQQTNNANLSSTTLYYHENKPSSLNGNGDDQIYIDCKPTGNSEETSDVTFNKNTSINDTSNILSSPLLVYILYIIVLVAIIVIIFNILKYID
jgi:carbonic anhydrase